MLQGEEVLELRGVRLRDGGALWLELAQPVQRALEPVHPGEGVDVGVRHDPEAVAAGSERYEPHPVTGPHEVVGALPAKPRRDARVPRRIVRPVVDLHA